MKQSSIMQVQHQTVNPSFTIQKEVPVTSNSEMVPLIKEDCNSRACASNNKKIVDRNHSKCTPVGGRLPYFITAWEKITQDQEIYLL